MGRPRLPDPVNHCRQCGALMKRKEVNGKVVQDIRELREQKFCNRRCMALNMEGTIKVENEHNYHRQSAKQVKEACEACGKTDCRLHVHHMDENPMNNSPENLKTLCGSCHRQAHSPHFEGMPPRRKPCLHCDKGARRKGLCFTHLTRLRKHGDPLLVKRGNGYGTWFVRSA